MTIESEGAGQGGRGTVVFRGSYRRVQRGLRKELVAGQADAGDAPVPTVATAGDAPPAKIAALLAFAHHVQRLIDAGRVADRAEVARRVGWTRARVSQVLDLLMLAPDLQEAVLAVTAGSALTERVLRVVVRCEDWRKQREVFAALAAAPD